jgi:high-affinity Fe2+/Pb2+ permease
MPTSDSKPSWRRSLLIAGYVCASALGGVLGWNFGNKVAGPWLGAITGINSALFCAMLMGLAERLLARLAGKTWDNQV